MIEKFAMSNFSWFQKEDLFARFKQPKEEKLPFKKYVEPSIAPGAVGNARQRYLKVLLVGAAVGFALETAMIKGGYYQALIDAERKRQLKK